MIFIYKVATRSFSVGYKKMAGKVVITNLRWTNRIATGGILNTPLKLGGGRRMIHYSQLGRKLMMFEGRKNLGENIYQLKRGRKISQLEYAFKHFISSEMTVDLNVLSTLVEDRILGNLEGRLTITMESNWLCMRNTKFR